MTHRLLDDLVKGDAAKKLKMTAAHLGAVSSAAVSTVCPSGAAALSSVANSSCHGSENGDDFEDSPMKMSGGGVALSIFQAPRSSRGAQQVVRPLEFNEKV